MHGVFQGVPSLTAVERIACLITGSDPDLLALCPKGERRAGIFHACLLVLVSSVAGVVWWAFWLQLLPEAAIPLGCACGLFIFLVHQAIGAAVWPLRGVLSQHIWRPSFGEARRLLVGLGKC